MNKSKTKTSWCSKAKMQVRRHRLNHNDPVLGPAYPPCRLIPLLLFISPNRLIRWFIVYHLLSMAVAREVGPCVSPTSSILMCTGECNPILFHCRWLCSYFISKPKLPRASVHDPPARFVDHWGLRTTWGGSPTSSCQSLVLAAVVSEVGGQIILVNVSTRSMPDPTSSLFAEHLLPNFEKVWTRLLCKTKIRKRYKKIIMMVVRILMPGWP